MKIISFHELEEESFNEERRIIAKLISDGYSLYNLTSGGDGTSGMKMSEEAKRKVSLYRTGKTHSSEQLDKISGENNYGAKLDWVKVETIRELRRQGVSGRKLAKQFNVSPSTIVGVCKYRTWKINR